MNTRRKVPGWWETTETEEAEFTMSDDDNKQSLPTTIEQEITNQFNQDVGALKGLAFINKVTAVAVAGIYKKIKESGTWKGQVVQTTAGAVTLTSWDLVCEHVFEKPKSVVNEGIQNLNTLGKHLYDAMDEAGISRDSLRLIRKLDNEQLEHIREEVAQCKKPTEVKKLFEETVSDLQRQLDEQKDNSEQIQNELEQRITDQEAMTQKYKAKFDEERATKQDKYSRDWDPRVARIRYLAGYASEQCRIALNGMYNLIKDTKELERDDDLPHDQYQGALDSSYLLAESLVAECVLVLKTMEQELPGFALANKTSTAFPYTEDEVKRLVLLRGDLQQDAISALEANHPAVAAPKRGPKPKLED